MRRVKVFSGSSHPELAEFICEKLGIPPAAVTLKKFSNQETSVEIGKYRYLLMIGIKCKLK